MTTLNIDRNYYSINYTNLNLWQYITSVLKLKYFHIVLYGWHSLGGETR